MSGGGQFGWVRASWPLVSMTVSANHLRLSGFIVGAYEFRPNEVVSLEPYGLLPIISRGVRIVHTRLDYPSKVVFWRGSPEKLLGQIQRTGFRPSAIKSTALPARGFPISWKAIIISILVWNALLLADHSRDVFAGLSSGEASFQPGLLTLLALLLAFGLSWGTKSSSRLQRFVLRDGHSVGEILPFLSLLQMISGIMLVVFSLFVIIDTVAG
jgi:hypothetical protein